MNLKKEPEEREAPKKRKFRLGELVYRNGFVLAASFAAALVCWFVMAKDSELDGTQMIYDVPINVTLSPQADADGLRVFNTSYSTVDIEVSGSSLITSKLTAEDFQVTAQLNPTSTKLAGNTTEKMAVQVRAIKKSAATDYEVVSTNPDEIAVEYDRYKEITLNIENEVEFTAGTGFYPGTPVLSEEKVNISGPESAVNKVKRAAVKHSFSDPLRDNASFSGPIILYDENGQEIIDKASLYLSQDLEEVEVTIPVMARKTVPLVVSWAHRPQNFSDSRISIQPENIELAGTGETLGGITEIRLDTVIDFAELDVNQRSATYTVEIPVPAGTRNITNSGTNTVSQATVTVNLSGYRQATVTVPESNIQLLNAPSGTVNAELITKTLDVVVAGPEAQINRLTGDSVTVQADMSNIQARPGSVDVPVTVSVTGTSGEACWVVGTYTMTVTMRAESGASSAPRQTSLSP
ncbi:hypothetical protein D7X94_03295 [Acutalibacter sp. 1XD8-33]|uniref:CdaR family protein n=1 Tax=Acutalibacter sp. 1XD8-33 TaxID=2320081 RepID=UPI000EA12BB9|nr:CdaR family protein [Acutalibacter sp. 1XD8-33]RKJ41328.1 hypothetical protein D7X94_03295 [Acutalibacter sp. 1XD8-33]